MRAPLFDAHNHLHDVRLDPIRATAIEELSALGVAGAMVNGTRPDDWPAVANLIAAQPWVQASYGLHPWHVGKCAPGWLAELETYLQRDQQAAVGEIGLDRWVEGHDLAAQTEVLRAQLALAVRLDRPVTLHCLKAWGALWEIVRAGEMPSRGFLLHAYGGPVEMVRGFVERGAYFSFSPYFLHERKAAQRAVFQTIPEDRLLVETDAPDMSPPPDRNPRPLADSSGKPVNHPANIDLAYIALAELRGISRDDLAEIVARNFTRLFRPG